MAETVQASHKLAVETRGKGFTEITRELSRWLDTLSAENGLLTVFICHTSASLVVQENADPNVRRDLLDALEALAPEGRAYAHQEEGPGVYVVEHRAAPHRRTVVLSYIGHVAEA
jgi:secondary thiamine-phosphate synthase enzyme